MRIASPPRYFTAVTVRRGATSADGVQNSSLPTQVSKASRLCQRVITSTSSAPSVPSELRTSIETKTGKFRTCPRLLANRSTICPAAPFLTGSRLSTASYRTSRLLPCGDYAAATNALGRAERLECRGEELSGVLPMLGISRYPSIDPQQISGPLR